MTSLGGAYNRLFAASLTSNVADGVGKIALPLLAASLTRDPALVAGLTAFQFLPWLLLAIPAGAIVDRVDRRSAVAWADGFRAVVVTALAFTVAADAASIVLLYVVAFLLGSAETIADSASHALLPAVVAPEQLDAANGRLQSAVTVADGFVGAPIAGFLFAAGAALPFGLNASGFVVAALLMTRLPRVRPAPTEGVAARASLTADIVEGLRWLWRDRDLKNLTVIAGATGLVNAATNGLLVLFALERLGLSEATFGVFITSAAVGGALGGLTAARTAARFGRAGTMTLTLAVVGAGYLAFGLSTNPVLAGLVFAVEAWAILVWNVVTMSMRQQLVPGHLFGRVLGAWRTVVWGCMPLGAVIGGFLGRVDLRLPFVVAAGVHTLLVLPTSRVARRLARRHADLKEDAPAVDV